MCDATNINLAKVFLATKKISALAKLTKKMSSALDVFAIYAVANMFASNDTIESFCGRL